MKFFFLLLLAMNLTVLLSAKDLRPESRPDAKTLLIVKGTWSCQIGYGSEQDQLQYKGVPITSQTVLNPTHALSTAGYIGFGCISPGLYFDYSQLDRTLSLPPNTSIQGQTWDSLDYSLDQLDIGQSFSLIEHRAYFDLGIGVSVSSFNFSSNPATTPPTPIQLKQQNQFLHSRFRLYFNHLWFGTYEYLYHLNQKKLIQGSAKLGVNFRVQY